MADGVAAGVGAWRGARFALAKFRPTTLPGTLVGPSGCMSGWRAGRAGG